MPKRKTRRRFNEPRCGVSQAMVEAEGRELKREIDSYLVQSLTTLKETIEQRQAKYRETDAVLSSIIGRLPERERLSAMCMLGRDLYLVLQVYLEFLRNHEPGSPVPRAPTPPPQLPFSDWLFAR
jgi:hypothetical protein